ncbi:MAG TPA: hypothetical protein VMQ76_08680 [Terracidiphilus sp.]|nr:hypothetical protein [Terracidiphilus sp.]
MRFPWVSRAEFEAAEHLRLAAQQMLAQSEVARIKAEDAAREKYEAVFGLWRKTQEQLEVSNAERKLLLDRIVQMSGQPALYEKPTAEAKNRESGEQQEMPSPRSRVGFDDVHEALRAAVKNGTYGIRGKVN